jgi:hypothetical protein
VTRYREEPIYDDWCSYTVNRWGHDHWVTAEGTGADVPRWPAVQVTACGSLGCTREGTRTAHYTLSLAEIEGPARQECQVDERVWVGAVEGERRPVQIGVIDGGIRCSSWGS